MMPAITSPNRTLRFMFNLLGIAICLLAGTTFAQDFNAIQIATTPVRDNIYMLQGSGGNIAVNIGEEGTLIVDAQFAPLTNKIVAAIGGLTDKPVTFVVNTHFHYDHTDGNSQPQEE